MQTQNKYRILKTKQNKAKKKGRTESDTLMKIKLTTFQKLRLHH